MRCTLGRSTKLRPLSVFALVFSIGAAANDPLEFTRGTLDLNRSKIVFRAKSPDAFKRELSKLIDKANWSISKAGVLMPNAIEDVAVDELSQGISVYFKPGTFPVLDPEDIATDSVRVILKPGSIPADVDTGENAHFTSAASFKSCLHWTGEKDKKKADVDVSGGWQAAFSAKPLYNWSVKAACPIYNSATYGEIGPSFKAEASQQGNADPDSMKASITWKRASLFGTPFRADADLLGYEFERAIKKEPFVDDAGKPIDQKFLEKNSNLMWSGVLKYVNSKTPLNFTMGGGFEAGLVQTRTVKKTSQSQEEQGVSRLLFNATTDYIVFRGGQPFLTIHGEHTTRLPFIQEPFKRVDVNGGAMYLTNKPRHWTSLEFLFGIRKGLGVVIAYRRGSLPPSFEFVDHQMTLGLNILLKRK